MLMQILVGDASGDGHGKYDQFLFEVEGAEASEIQEAYLRSCYKTGVNLHLHGSGIAVECENPTMSFEQHKKLKEAGYDRFIRDYEDFEDFDKETIFYLNSGDIAYIYMFLASLELNFTYRMILVPVINTRTSIGYGVFYL